MKKNSLVAILSLFCFFFVVLNSVWAQEFSDPSIDLSEMRLVALVDAGNIKIEDKGNNNFEISFDILNQEGVQPYVRYAVNLIKKDGEQEVVLDRKVYDDVLYIGNKEMIHKTVSYGAPAYLSSGNYFLFLEAQNSSGLRLAYVPGGEVSLINLSEDGNRIEIKDNACRVFFGDNYYSGEEDLSRMEIDKPNLRCKAINISREEVGAYLRVDVYEKSYLENANSSRMSEKVSIKPNEEKEFRIDLGGDELRGSLLTASLFSEDNRKISRIMDVPYYVFGNNASLFYNIRIDKDYYLKDEKSKITVDARPVYPEGSIVSYSLAEKNGLSCFEAKSQEKTLDDTGSLEISEKIVRNCFDFTLSVSVKNKDGRVLDEEKYAIESRSKEAQEAKGRSNQSSKSSRNIQALILFFLAIIIIARIAFAVFNKIKCKNPKLPLILLFLLSGLFLFSNNAQARTFVHDINHGTDCCGQKYGVSFEVVANDNTPPRDGNTAYYFPLDDKISYSGTVTRKPSYGGCLGCYEYLFGMENRVTPASVSLTNFGNAANYYNYGGPVTLLSTNLYDPLYGCTSNKPCSISATKTINRIPGTGAANPGHGVDSNFPSWQSSLDGSNFNYGASGGSFEIESIGDCWHSMTSRFFGYCQGAPLYEECLCDFGYPGEVSCGANVTWTCHASAGSSYDVNCSYPIGSTSCGSAAGVASATKPMNNLCSGGGTASATLSNDCTKWEWTCGNLSFCQANCSAPLLTGTSCSGSLPPSYLNFEACPGDNAVTGNNAWHRVSSCSSDCKDSCEYKCKTGYVYQLNPVSGIQECVVPLYSCKGSPIANATFCEGSDVGLTSNQNYKSYDQCYAGYKCAYACNAGYVPYDNNKCIKKAECGTASGVPTCNKPSGADLCVSPYALYGNVTESAGQWKWTCGYLPVSIRTTCYAPIECNYPSCGPAKNNTYCVLTGENVDLCNGITATNFNASSADKFTWTCGSDNCLARKHCVTNDIWKEINPK